MLYGGKRLGKVQFVQFDLIKSFVLLELARCSGWCSAVSPGVKRGSVPRIFPFEISTISVLIYCFEFGDVQSGSGGKKLVKILSNRELVLYERSAGRLNLTRKIRGREERDF